MTGRDDVEVRGSPIHGVGVFAKRAFSKGEDLFMFNDERIVDDQHPLDAAKGESAVHCDWFPDHVILMGEPERYLNHSCEPDCFARTDEEGRRWLVAYRDIDEGDELTHDYLIDAFDGDEWDCNCRVAGCRRHHIHDFFTLPDHKLREYLPLVSPWFREWKAEEILRVERRLGVTATECGRAFR